MTSLVKSCCLNAIKTLIVPNRSLTPGGAGEPRRGLPAAAEHALPDAVLVRTGPASAQRGRGVSASAVGRAAIRGGELRRRQGRRLALGGFPATRRAPRALPDQEEGRHAHVRTLLV